MSDSSTAPPAAPEVPEPEASASTGPTDAPAEPEPPSPTPTEDSEPTPTETVEAASTGDSEPAPTETVEAAPPAAVRPQESEPSTQARAEAELGSPSTAVADLERPAQAEAAGESPPMGTFDEDGQYTPRQVVTQDLDDAGLEAAYTETMVDVEDGQLVEGTILKVDHDEVLLDIGYKSEGVIPARELSIRNDADPGDIVHIGDSIEALVLQKEDKEGRLLLSKKRAPVPPAWRGNRQLLPTS